MGNAAREPIVIIQNELHEATSIKAATLSGSERVATNSARRTIVKPAIRELATLFHLFFKVHCEIGMHRIWSDEIELQL